MATFLHGIGASENIDSSGERISIKGMDISTLAFDGCFTYEHEIATNEKGEKINVKFPEQTVGKILKAKKIFSAKDCENEHELHFWNKIKTPYIYLMGELFDDYTDAARDLAGKLRYDADRKGQNKHSVINFSIEGRYVAKEGMEVTKSIARKCTITSLPCNKAAEAELLVPGVAKKDELESIFKTEQTEVEFFKPSSEYIEFLAKKEEDMMKLELEIGTDDLAKSWSPGKPSRDAIHFSHPEHGTVSIHKQPGGEYHVKHQGAMAGLKGVGGTFKSPQEAGAHAKNYMAAISSNKVAGHKLHNRPSPQMVGKFTMHKASEAGSGMAAPSELTQGAALGKEDLEKGIKPKLTKDEEKPLSDRTPNEMKPGEMYNIGLKNGQSAKYHRSTAAAHHFSSENGSKLHKVPRNKPLTKSKWLARAEQSYKTWEKKEEFRSFMRKSMPHLALGEIDAIGQVISLRKAIQAEEALSKMANLEKALKFGSADDQAKVAAALEERKKNPPKVSKEPHKKSPQLKSRVESEVTHVKPYGNEGKHETVHLKSGHILDGHPAGKFKVGDKVVAQPHIMGTHVMEHKK